MKNLNLHLLTAVSLLTTVWSNNAAAGPQREYVADKNAVAETRAEQQPRWYVSLGGGTDFDYGTTDFSNKVFADLGGPALDIRSHPFDEVYDTNFYRLQAEVGYALNSHLELFGNFRYSKAESEGTRGSFLVLPPNGARAEIFDRWGDYKSYGGEVGVRCFFLPPAARFRPYVSLSGGAAYVESIDLRAALGNGTVLFQGGFYDSGLVGTGTALLGVEVALTKHVSIGADAGIRYESTLNDNKRDVVAAGFAPVAPINTDAGDRLYCPLTVYAKFRF